MVNIKSPKKINLDLLKRVSELKAENDKLRKQNEFYFDLGEDIYQHVDQRNLYDYAYKITRAFYYGVMVSTIILIIIYIIIMGV